jgi:orotidine-5'-phosphate decarboxylase
MESKIVLAVDKPTIPDALPIVESVAPEVGYIKCGLELLNGEGTPRVVKFAHEQGVKLFVDLKLNDIPNTVYGTAKVVAKMGVDMLNLHCIGGPEMMEAARRGVDEAVEEAGLSVRPKLLGVTVLTSLDYESFVKMGLMKTLNIADPKELAEAQDREIERLVRRLALLAQEAGLDGVISSPKEIRPIRESCQPEFLVVTPGVRLEESSMDDQKRTSTPAGAIEAGADLLVIGRPITKAADPIAAAKAINDEIWQALEERERG